ncbi:MAG: hypothetical protein AAF447_11265 [Myxococcota bacterium]
MPSKLVTDRQKSAELVLAIQGAQGARLGEGLGATLDAEPAAQALRFMTTLTGLLADARDGMVRADAAHEAELGDDPAARQARDKSTDALRDLLVGLRDNVRGLYGTERERDIFRQPTPFDPVVLARYAREVAGRLGALAGVPGRLAGSSLEPEPAAQALGAAATRLDDALTRVAEEAREAQVTLTAKDEALARYDAVFTATASTLAALFQLAGESELARRVRPSRRRPGRVDGSTDTPLPEAAPEGSTTLPVLA